MFVHSSKFLTPCPEDNQLQPNATDITIDRLFKIDSESTFYLSKNSKQSKETHEITPVIDDRSNVSWVLEPGQYEFESMYFCEIPAQTVGWLIGRSTLNRSGIFVASGLYDSGFKGHVGGTIYCFGPALIEQGTRIAQLVTCTAESINLYQGQYQYGK